MAKVKVLILAGFLLAGVLGACAPTINPAGPEDTFKLEGQNLVLNMSSAIIHAEGSVFGSRVTSRFCEGGVTQEPVPCPNRPSGYTALDVPEGQWSARLVVGRAEKLPNLLSFFDVQLEGKRVSFRAELTP